MSSDLFDYAVELINNGDIDRGRKALLELLENDPRNEEAWIWMFKCVKTNDQLIFCLQKALELNPANDYIKAELASLSTDGNELPTIGLESYAEFLKLIQEEDAKSKEKKESHSFNPNSYDVIFIKGDDNLYSKSERALFEFPEVDSAMYGAKLIIGGISITPHDHPVCVENGKILKSQCLSCEFFSMSDCPIRQDPSILSDAGKLFLRNKQYRKEYLERRDLVIEAIYGELKEHGRPLHYELLAKMLKDRYPRLHLSSKIILHSMNRHPEKFEWKGAGVYEAR